MTLFGHEVSYKFHNNQYFFSIIILYLNLGVVLSPYEEANCNAYLIEWWSRNFFGSSKTNAYAIGRLYLKPAGNRIIVS